MCGIAGFISEQNIDNRKGIIKAMTDCIIHRGPDAEGMWLDEQSGVTLGHRRLSIMDLSANGSQPMMSSSERYVISYNGEIYNSSELKKHLESRGHNIEYRGTSDTEVLLESFDKLGIENTLNFVKGMFAIALYDRQDKKLYLTRDRVGEKPLYYGFVGGAFVFASEIQCFKSFPGFSGDINQDAVVDFCHYGYVPAPMTIYQGINKLMPGCVLEIAAPYKEHKVWPYWEIIEVAKRGESSPFKGSFEEAVEELDRLMTESVRGQMVSDVALGAYLSGGIDSASVVSIMTKLSSGSDKVKTFTIGFDDKKYNEAEYAKDIAKHLGTDHTVLYVGEKELKDVIPKLPEIYSEPFADSSQIPTYLVSKLAREKVTVSLSGDAGDELFAGYRTYDKLLPVWNKASKVPGGLRHLTGNIFTNAHFGSNKIYRGARCLRADNIVEMRGALEVTSLYKDKVAGREVKLVDDKLLKGQLGSLLLTDMLHYHPDDILVKVDRAGMAVSLENRIPMLDRDIVEFAFSLPDDYKLIGKNGKRVLKSMLYKYVPEEMMNRPKKGFSVPLTKWLTEGDTALWASELMTSSKLAEAGILEKDYVEKLWGRFKKGNENSRFVWNILMLEQWYRHNTK